MGTGLGGAGRDRTDDLLNAIQALSQLSYGPIFIDCPLDVQKNAGEFILAP